MARELSGPRAMETMGRNVNALIHALEIGAPEGLEEFAKRFVGSVQELIDAPGFSENMGEVNPRSLPGEPPAIQTGEYHDSWDYKMGREGIATWYADCGSPVEYGPYLEFGTQKMAPRPHVRPVLDAHINHMSELLVEKMAERQREVLHGMEEMIVNLGGKGEGSGILGAIRPSGLFDSGIGSEGGGE